MQFVKWSVLSLAAAVFLVLGTRAMAADATNAVSGKASCGHCSGVVSGKCCVLLTDSNGDRWVLKGQNDILQAAMAEQGRENDDRHHHRKARDQEGKGRQGLQGGESLGGQDRIVTGSGFRGSRGGRVSRGFARFRLQEKLRRQKTEREIVRLQHSGGFAGTF